MARTHQAVLAQYRRILEPVIAHDRRTASMRMWVGVTLPDESYEILAVEGEMMRERMGADLEVLAAGLSATQRNMVAAAGGMAGEAPSRDTPVSALRAFLDHLEGIIARRVVVGAPLL